MYALRVLAQQNKDPKPIAVFMHHPPFQATKCPDPIQFLDYNTMLSLRNTLSNINDIKSIFCGHIHRFDSGSINGIPIMCIPSVAINLRWGKYSAEETNRPVYQIHNFDSLNGIYSETRFA